MDTHRGFVRSAEFRCLTPGDKFSSSGSREIFCTLNCLLPDARYMIFSGTSVPKNKEIDDHWGSELGK